MILDHRVISGCGNIYACEALFRAGIHPARLSKDLKHQEREMVFYYVREVLEVGIKMEARAYQITYMQMVVKVRCNYI